LTHGNEIEFGEKATIDIKVEAKPEEAVPQPEVFEPSAKVEAEAEVKPVAEAKPEVEIPMLAFDNVEPYEPIKPLE
jgi:hypothetical protein